MYLIQGEELYIQKLAEIQAFHFQLSQVERTFPI